MNKLNNSTIIRSVSNSQEEILGNIQKLYCPEGFDVDLTYSKGNFYKNIKEPKLKFDINPQTKNTIKASSVDIPLKHESVKSIVFDPPFLATTYGKNGKGPKGNNIITKRFGEFKSMKDLWDYYNKSLIEMHEILKPDGFVIFKCQDCVSSGKQYLSLIEIITKAIQLNLYPKDIFILVAKTRIISGKHVKQYHARKFHSYFVILQKKKVNIPYNILKLSNDETNTRIS